MEMEQNSTPPPIAQGAVSVTNPPASVSATPVTAAAPVQGGAAPVTPVMANGGETSGSFLRNVNWVQIGFLMLGTAALFSLIYYHTQDMKRKKVSDARLTQLGRQIDELKMNIKPAMKGKYKELQ